MARQDLLEVVLEVAAELAEADRAEDLLERSMTALLRVLAGEVVGYSRVDVVGRSADVLLRPSLPGHRAPMTRAADTMDDHPLIQHWVRAGVLGPPRRVSDVTSPRAWRRTRTYAEVLRPMGSPHLLAVPLCWDRSGGTAYAVGRSGTDFTDRERDVAAVLQPVLVALHRRLPVVPTGPPADDRADPDARCRAAARQVGVTPRQHEVLRLVAQGRTAEAIARTLVMSPRTVHKHLQRLYATLEVCDRLSAVERARTIGLLEPVRATDPLRSRSAKVVPVSAGALTRG